MTKIKISTRGYASAMDLIYALIKNLLRHEPRDENRTKMPKVAIIHIISFQALFWSKAYNKVKSLVIKSLR